MTEQYLQHHGVKGMKWGHHKPRVERLRAKSNQNMLIANINKTAARRGNGLFSKVNNVNAKYYEHRANTLNNKANKLQEKKEYKQKIRKAESELWRNSSLSDKMNYNNATYRKAAKYVAKNDMSYSQAMKKAKGVARRNTAAFIGAFAAAAIAPSVINAAGNHAQNSRNRRSIPKLAQSKKYNPIDVGYKILN